MRLISLARTCAVMALAAMFAVTPAKATIEKIMNQCDGKLCPFFRASIVIPDGWVADKGATRHFNSQFLLPRGEIGRASCRERVW